MVPNARQEPRYTKHPSTWLHDGCWEDEAPPGAVIDENGNVVAIEHSEPTEDTDDVYERCEQMALVAYGGKPW
jgi:hypothetical protein